MKNINKQLILLTILALGACTAQPSGILPIAKNILQKLPPFANYVRANELKSLENKFFKTCFVLKQDATNQRNLERLPERIQEIFQTHVSIVNASRAKAEKANQLRHLFDLIVASATGLGLGYAGNHFAKDNEKKTQLIKKQTQKINEEFRLQKVFSFVCLNNGISDHLESHNNNTI